MLGKEMTSVNDMVICIKSNLKRVKKNYNLIKWIKYSVI